MTALCMWDLGHGAAWDLPQTGELLPLLLLTIPLDESMTAAHL